VRLSFFSSRLLSPESVLLATAAAPFFFLRKGSSRGQRDASGITATTVTIAPKGGKVPVLLGEVLRAPDTQYIIPNSRDLRNIREVLIKMLNSWQYPHRVTSLRNSETGAACVLTSTLTAGTRFPFQRERVRILFFSFPLDSLVFPKFPTYRHLMSIFIIMKRFWRTTVEILK